MKRAVYILGVTLCLFGLMSCGVTYGGIYAGGSSDHAPGQMKKVYGEQSAKRFAPGQMKKAYGAQSAREFAPGQQRKYVNYYGN